MSKSISPLDFQTQIVQQLEAFVASLPKGVAQLSTGRVPGHPEWAEPYFEITPRNPRAAPIKGVGVATDLELTVGNSWREFYGFARGGTILPGATWQEEVHCICVAVAEGRLVEQLTLNSEGKVIGWNSKLTLDNKDLIFRNGRRAGSFFERPKLKTVSYEPWD